MTTMTTNAIANNYYTVIIINIRRINNSNNKTYI